jgi:flavin-dependent dehydrogenase
MRRSTFDRMLLEEAGSRGVSILQPATVWSITRRTDGFDTHCTTPRGEQTIRSRWAVGAFGKSSPLEKHLRRPFAGIRTGLNGVKFHLPSPALAETGTDEILICHGPDGYCGINHVDGGLATICFLERHAHAERGARGWVRDLTGDNPAFARIMTPEALDAVAHAPVHGGGNIFFGKRSLVEQGIFMVGDAARVIAPLAGDGIGMALQGAQLLGRSFERDRRVSSGPGAWESRYRREWQEMFRRRVWTALVLQRTLLSAPLRRVVSSALAVAPSLVRPALTMTRG